MPMIDVHAAPGTFADVPALLQRLASTFMQVEQVPPIDLFRDNTAAFLHDVAVSDAAGSAHHVRVQVLTNAGALDRAQQLAAVEQITQIVADAAGDPRLAARTWVLLTETYDGGWGIGGHAHKNEDIVALARQQLAAG